MKNSDVIDRIKNDMFNMPRLPKFYLIFNAIHYLILEEKLKKGDKLPGQCYISINTGISLFSIKKAWSELKEFGFIKCNKNGTFIIKSPCSDYGPF